MAKLSVVMITSERFFRMSGVQHALFAFRGALTARAHLKLARCRAVIEGQKLTREAGQLKYLPAVLILSLTVDANSCNAGVRENWARTCATSAGG